MRDSHISRNWKLRHTSQSAAPRGRIRLQKQLNGHDRTCSDWLPSTQKLRVNVESSAAWSYSADVTSCSSFCPTHRCVSRCRHGHCFKLQTLIVITFFLDVHEAHILHPSFTFRYLFHEIGDQALIRFCRKNTCANTISITTSLSFVISCASSVRN